MRTLKILLLLSAIQSPILCQDACLYFFDLLQQGQISWHLQGQCKMPNGTKLNAHLYIGDRSVFWQKLTVRNDEFALVLTEQIPKERYRWEIQYRPEDQTVAFQKAHPKTQPWVYSAEFQIGSLPESKIEKEQELQLYRQCLADIKSWTRLHTQQFQEWQKKAPAESQQAIQWIHRAPKLDEQQSKFQQWQAKWLTLHFQDIAIMLGQAYDAAKDWQLAEIGELFQINSWVLPSHYDRGAMSLTSKTQHAYLMRLLSNIEKKINPK